MPVILDPRKSLFFIKGQEARELDIARNMIRKGVAVELVQECTDLPMSQILKLMEEIKSK